MQEQVKVKIYVKYGNVVYTTTCLFSDVETELKKICISQHCEYGVQIIFSTEQYISDYITNSDVFKMNFEQFQNFVDNIYLQQDLIAIFIGYKLSGNKEAVNKIINYDDIVWLHYVDDDTPSAYDEYRDLGWDFIIKNK